MPAHVAQILIDRISFDQRNQKILILGISYKPDTSDSRNSPTEGIILALRNAGFMNISVHDPYLNESFGAIFISDLYSGVMDSDCVIIVTGHSAYTSLTTGDFRKGCTIIDAARILDKSNFMSGEIKYVPLGS
jgi:UDP-N-acetyl-D-mannosaminuronate dehydrogenase